MLETWSGQAVGVGVRSLVGLETFFDIHVTFIHNLVFVEAHFWQINELSWKENRNFVWIKQITLAG